ncbi:MAG: hypothetical protein LBM67_01730 [Lentimicrobiaceae bacterium]|jgi:hypothetical protein|nr:hypothetical protein [Lentimicrobiaceae bacterium]
MNTLFSFKRFGLLLQRYFYERRKHDLLFWSITVLVLMLSGGSVQFSVTYLVVSGAIFVSNLFREIHSKTQGINYFMLPATQLEKITMTLFVSVIYYFAMFLITYIIGNILGTLLNNLLATFLPWFSHTSFFAEKFVQMPLKETFMAFVFVQAIFLLGGIYFKRNAFLKTVFSIFALIFALLIIEMILVSLFIERTFTTSLFPEEMMSFSLHFETFYKRILNILGYLFVPFVWIVSYFRLTEKEV